MAFTQVSGTNVYYETQALSRAAPTTDIADGVPMKDLDAFTVIVEANSTKTISGGTMAAYLWDPYVAAWSRCAELDFTPTTSVRRASANFTIAGVRAGTRILFATASITVSGGTDVLVYTIGGRARGA